MQINSISYFSATCFKQFPKVFCWRVVRTRFLNYYNLHLRIQYTRTTKKCHQHYAICYYLCLNRSNQCNKKNTLLSKKSGISLVGAEEIRQAILLYFGYMTGQGNRGQNTTTLFFLLIEAKMISLLLGNDMTLIHILKNEVISILFSGKNVLMTTPQFYCSRNEFLPSTP